MSNVFQEAIMSNLMFSLPGGGVSSAQEIAQLSLYPKNEREREKTNANYLENVYNGLILKIKTEYPSVENLSIFAKSPNEKSKKQKLDELRLAFVVEVIKYKMELEDQAEKIRAANAEKSKGLDEFDRLIEAKRFDEKSKMTLDELIAERAKLAAL
jgi:hypothetical protein